MWMAMDEPVSRSRQPSENFYDIDGSATGYLKLHSKYVHKGFVENILLSLPKCMLYRYFQSKLGASVDHTGN